MFLTDLVELMMMQNAQMHQVIMNNMTMSALSSFGYVQAHGVNKIQNFFKHNAKIVLFNFFFYSLH